MNYFVLQVSEFLEGIRYRLSGKFVRLQERMNRATFSWSVRSALYRHMSTQISNDINQIAALSAFKRRLVREKRKSSLYVIDDVIRRMRNGSEISTALSVWIPVDEVLIISGAEAAGHVDTAFELLLQAKDRTANVRRSMVSAFTTPAVYLIAVYGLLWAIGTYFLPSIQNAMPESKAQGMGAALYGMGNFATSFWILLPIATIACLVVWVLWALPNWTSNYRRIADRFYPFSFYRDIQGYVWLLTFASMLQAGMSDTKILLDQSRLGSPWLNQRILAIRRRMVNGEGLASALHNVNFDFPSPDMIDDITSMVDFDDFPARIMRRTVQWADEMERNVKVRTRMIGFAFDMVMYGLILFVLLGMNSLSTQMGSAPGLQ